MKVDKAIKNLFHNHTVLFVVVSAVVLVYFIDTYSKGKSVATEGATNNSQISAAAFSDAGGAFPFNPPDVAATNKAGIGNAFNIGSQFERTMNELGNLIIKVAGLEGKLSLDHKDSKEVYKSYEDIKRRIPGVEKAKKLLNWSAKIEPKEGIKRTYEWYKNHPEFLNI